MGGTFNFSIRGGAARLIFSSEPDENNAQKMIEIKTDFNQNVDVELHFNTYPIKLTSYNKLMCQENDFYGKYGIPFLLQIQDYDGPTGFHEDNIAAILGQFHTHNQIANNEDNQNNRNTIAHLFRTIFNLTNKSIIAGLCLTKVFSGHHINEDKIKAVLSSIDQAHLAEQVTGIIRPQT